MFQYSQGLARLRACEADREIARSGMTGRQKVAAFRAIALGYGWLAPDRELPRDSELAAAVGKPRHARSALSSVEP